MAEQEQLSLADSLVAQQLFLMEKDSWQIVV